MSDNKIHVLPPALCDQIAAGEVLERASSAVKELVENALDAGATAIQIEIEEGGRKRLCVTDNGCGMTREDARLSVIRHATSKIATVEDLAKIGTMGFRGEALASMAAVSKLTIQTKRAEDETGTYFRMEGSVETACRETAVPNGTQITIEDLFFNTPARLKFLKTTATEQRRVYEVVEQFALACPNVAFKLMTDGRVKCDFPKNKTLIERAHAVLGRSLAEHLYPVVPVNLGQVQVEGAFCSPDYIQSASGRLFTYVNHRIVKDKTIISAINQAYREFLNQGKLPCVILFVSLPFDMVDVNVHPTKNEIRFQDADNVFRAVYRALRQSLEATPWIKTTQVQMPSAFVSPEKQADTQKLDLRSGSVFESVHSGVFGKMPASAFEPPERSLRADLGIPDPTIRWAGQKTLDHQNPPTQGDACASDGVTFCDDDDGFAADGGEVKPSLPCPQMPDNMSFDEARDNVRAELVLMREPSMPGRVAVAMGKEPMLPLDDAQAHTGYFSSLHFLGQYALTYLICTDSDDHLVFVDQHAAHERINYEKLRLVYQGKLPPEAQGLLFPIVLSLDTRMSDTLREFMSFFEQLGFQIDALSDTSFAIRYVPKVLLNYDYQALLRDALTDLAESGRSTEFEAICDHILATMACHKSIRAGHRMTEADAMKLFRAMDETVFKSNCPHGRPVHFIMTANEIEKRFLRT
jgi:DNA mismatch repair protein MutL